MSVRNVARCFNLRGSAAAEATSHPVSASLAPVAELISCETKGNCSARESSTASTIASRKAQAASLPPMPIIETVKGPITLSTETRSSTRFHTWSAPPPAGRIRQGRPSGRGSADSGRGSQPQNPPYRGQGGDGYKGASKARYFYATERSIHRPRLSHRDTRHGRRLRERPLRRGRPNRYPTRRTECGSHDSSRHRPGRGLAREKRSERTR